LSEMRAKILILTGHETSNTPVIAALRQYFEVAEISDIDQAVDALRNSDFTAVFSDSGDFLPLERALVSQQANLVLNTIGDAVCIIDREGRCNWMNKKMQSWTPRVHETVRRTCVEAFETFNKQQQTPTSDPPPSRSKKYSLTIDDTQFLDLTASPVVNPRGQVVQVVAVIQDVSGPRRMEQKIDAIDRAGSELMKLEAEAVSKLNVGQRLTLLEEKIVGYTRELMHFDHFAIRVLDRKTNKLEVVISAGLPTEALNIDLYARPEGNGISGYVAATARSYICPDIDRDPRYVTGLDQAKSSLTVPLKLYDKVIGVFNIESRQRGAFNEDDRRFAEIFGRYIAMALNILNLMVVERQDTAHKIADDVAAEVAGPLNDIAIDAGALIDDYIGREDLQGKLRSIMDNVGNIRKSLNQVAAGPNTSVLGASSVKESQDPVLAHSRILVADDEENIRLTISDVLRKYGVRVTLASNATDAMALLEQNEFDLILSDIRMPDKTGYDVFASARKKSHTLPVILMTGFGYDPHHCIVRASQEGLQAVLFKPFKVDQLLAEIRKGLQSQPANK